MASTKIKHIFCRLSQALTLILNTAPCWATCKVFDSVLLKNEFEIYRDYGDYSEIFSGELAGALNAAEQKGGIWVDWGAGSAKAQRTAKFTSKKIAVAYKKPEKLDLDSAKRDKVGTDLRNKEVTELEKAIETKEILYIEANLNHPFTFGQKAEVATDVYGPLSYADDLTQVLTNEINGLTEGGKLFFKTSKSTSRTTIMFGKQELSLASFIGKIPGLRVDSLGWDYDTFVITKQKGDILIPAVELVSIDHSKKPPIRNFRIKQF